MRIEGARSARGGEGNFKVCRGRAFARPEGSIERDAVAPGRERGRAGRRAQEHLELAGGAAGGREDGVRDEGCRVAREQVAADRPPASQKGLGVGVDG